MFGTGAHPASDIWPRSRWGGRREGWREGFQLQNQFQKSVPLPSLLLLGAAGLGEPHAERRAQPEGEGLALKYSPKGTGWGEGTDRFPSSSVKGRPNLFPFCLFCPVQKLGGNGVMHRSKLLKQPKSPSPPPPSQQHNETQISKAGEKPTAELGTAQPGAGETPQGCRPPGLSPHQTTGRPNAAGCTARGSSRCCFPAENEHVPPAVCSDAPLSARPNQSRTKESSRFSPCCCPEL